jgi:hypothetical protein
VSAHTKHPISRNHKGIVGENMGENRLWISGIFAQVAGPSGRNRMAFSSPTIANQYQPFWLALAEVGEMGETDFRPSPSSVGGLGESPIRTRPPRPGHPQNGSKTGAVHS